MKWRRVGARLAQARRGVARRMEVRWRTEGQPDSKNCSLPGVARRALSARVPPVGREPGRPQGSGPARPKGLSDSMNPTAVSADLEPQVGRVPAWPKGSGARPKDCIGFRPA